MNSFFNPSKTPVTHVYDTCRCNPMNKGIIGLIALVLVTTTMLTLAMLMGVIKVNTYVSTGELDWEIMSGVSHLDGPGVNDWNINWTLIPDKIRFQTDKDVGQTFITLIDSDGDGDYDVLNITIVNAYPWYYEHVSFIVHNNGDIPIRIWRLTISNGTHEWYFYAINEQELEMGDKLDLDGDGVADILIWWGDNFGEQLHHCEEADISFDVTILQGAQENTSITLYLSLDAVQWNEYTPGPYP